MGGDIKVKSIIGVGSEFTFTIRDQNMSARSPGRRKFSLGMKLAKSHSSELDNLLPSSSKVLVVDDEPFNVIGIKAMLSKLQIDCASTYSA